MILLICWGTFCDCLIYFVLMISPKRLELIGLFGFELFANITATAKKIQDYVAQARENGLTDKKDFVAKVTADKRDKLDPLFEYEYVSANFSFLFSLKGDYITRVTMALNSKGRSRNLFYTTVVHRRSLIEFEDQFVEVLLFRSTLELRCEYLLSFFFIYINTSIPILAFNSILFFHSPLRYLLIM